MNVWLQLHCPPVYCTRLLLVLAFIALAIGFASAADAQRLTPAPFEFPPRFSAPLPNQAKSVVKTVLRRKPPTKAQLNQALLAEADRRNGANVTKLLAQGADPNARDKAGVPAAERATFMTPTATATRRQIWELRQATSWIPACRMRRWWWNTREQAQRLRPGMTTATTWCGWTGAGFTITFMMASAQPGN